MTEPRANPDLSDVPEEWEEWLYIEYVENKDDVSQEPSSDVAEKCEESKYFKNTSENSKSSEYFKDGPVGQVEPEKFERSPATSKDSEKIEESEIMTGESRESENPKAAPKKSIIEHPEGYAEYPIHGPADTKTYFFLKGVNHQGYFLKSKDKKNKKVTYKSWGCIKKHCTARFTQDDGLYDLKEVRPHLCKKTDHKSVNAKIAQLKAIHNAQERKAKTPKECFNLVEDNEPSLTKEVSFNKMQRTLQRECAKARTILGTVIDNKYDNLKQFGEYITEHPDDLSYETNDGITRKIKAKVFNSSSKSYHVLFYDDELMNKFTRDEIFIDGTFDARPQIKQVNQLLTILGTKYNMTVPIAWVLMSRRTIGAYKKVWTEIKELFPNFQPISATTDFEKGLRRSLKESFPGIKLIGCFFHYCQAIYRRAVRLRLAYKFNNKMRNPTGHILLKKVMALAYLPPDRIPKALQNLKKLVKQEQPEKEWQDKWDKFWAYFDREWMKIVQPKNFTVCNALDRTDNKAENYHHWLNALMGCKPKVPFFIENIIKLKERALNKFNKAKKGIKDVRPKSKLTTARDDRVEHAMRGLNKGIFDELKFLSEVAEPEDGEEVFEIYGKPKTDNIELDEEADVEPKIEFKIEDSDISEVDESPFSEDEENVKIDQHQRSEGDSSDESKRRNQYPVKPPSKSEHPKPDKDDSDEEKENQDKMKDPPKKRGRKRKQVTVVPLKNQVEEPERKKRVSKKPIWQKDYWK